MDSFGECNNPENKKNKKKEKREEETGVRTGVLLLPGASRKQSC